MFSLLPAQAAQPSQQLPIAGERYGHYGHYGLYGLYGPSKLLGFHTRMRNICYRYCP
jgi:hypothetical protein